MSSTRLEIDLFAALVLVLTQKVAFNAHISISLIQARRPMQIPY